MKIQASTETIGRSRTNDPEGMRGRLLDAAFLAFTTRGYHTTSVHDLKHQAEVSSGALAHHFPTKRDMGLAVLSDRVAAAVERTWIAPVVNARTAAEGIQTVFADTIAGLEKQGAVRGCPLNNLALELAGHDEAFRQIIDDIFARWRVAIADKIRADQLAGLAAPADPEQLATVVVALSSGAMTMSKASQSTLALKQCAAQLASLM